MDEKIIIGLIGEMGSGKDAVAEYLKEKYGAKLMRFADPLRETLGLYFDEISRDDLTWASIEFRERFGNDIFCKALEKKIKNETGVIVLNGIRLKDDLDFIKSFPKNYAFYITADQKLRWERTTKRGEKSDDSASFDKFQEMERAETEVEIPELGKMADFTIKNEKDLDFLKNSVDEIMKDIIQ